MSIQMNFNQLYVFYSVARHKSMAEAAKALHVSAPAVSMQIKKLEQWLGCPLFKRGSSPLELTAQGQKIFPLAENVFFHSKTLDDALHSLAKEQQDSLVIGLHVTPAQHIMPHLVRFMAKKMPHISLTMMLGSQEQNIQRLHNQEVHIAFVLGDLCKTKGIDMYPFMVQEMTFVVCAKNPLGLKGPVHIQELANTPVVLQAPDSGFAIFIRNYFNMHNVQPKVIMNTVPDAIAKNLVPGSEMGVFLGKSYAQKDIQEGKLRIVDIIEKPPPFTQHFACLSSLDNYAPARHFIKALPSQEVFTQFLQKKISA